MKDKKTMEELTKEFNDLQQKYNSIKERHKREITGLRQEQEIFRKAYLTNPDSINLTRILDGAFVSVNKGFTRILGYTEEEIIGKTTLEMNIWIYPVDHKNLIEKLEEKEEVKNFETRFLTKGGMIIYVLISASLIDLDGITHILSITRDITNRKRAEEAFTQEKHLLDAIMNNLPDYIYFKDPKSRFIRINKAHSQFFGLSDPAHAVGKTDFDFFTTEHAQQAYDDEQNIIRTGQLLKIEEKETHPNSPDTWVSTVKVPLHDEDGNITGTFGISRDVTERKRKELESHVLYEITQGVTSTDNLDELLKLIHQSISKVLYADNCFVALFNEKTGLFSFPYYVDKYDSKPLPTAMKKSCTAYVFRTVKPLILTQNVFENLLKQNEVELVGTNSPSWIGIPLQTPSRTIGVLVLQHYEKENIYNENDMKFLISIGSQIAVCIERKMAEEEIKLKTELLQAINAEKDKFFSILAHDLRGPMSSFVAATQILTEEIQLMTLAEIKEITSSMKTSASNIYSLLENLLEWSRLKRGMLEFVPERFNLRKKIMSGIEAVSESARKKVIDIDISAPEEIEVCADNHMFETVIRNLVSNAVKFTPTGGKISLSAYTNQDNLIEIKVSDTGIGMTPELKNKLFHLSEKTSRRGTEGEPSSGLGLLLCKEFIEKHNGEIWVESVVGKGSTFRFTINQK